MRAMSPRYDYEPTDSEWCEATCEHEDGPMGHDGTHDIGCRFVEKCGNAMSFGPGAVVVCAGDGKLRPGEEEFCTACRATMTPEEIAELNGEL